MTITFKYPQPLPKPNLYNFVKEGENKNEFKELKLEGWQKEKIL